MEIQLIPSAELHLQKNNSGNCFGPFEVGHISGRCGWWVGRLLGGLVQLQVRVLTLCPILLLLSSSPKILTIIRNYLATQKSPRCPNKGGGGEI